MFNDREIIRRSMKFAAEDPVKSWFYTLSTFLLMAIAFGLSCVNLPWPLRIVSSILAGLLLGRMFVIYHDYNHRAILTDSRLANLFMTCFGLFALAPRGIWSMVHDHHHDHNSKFCKIVLGSFPTLTKEKFNGLSATARLKYLIIRHPLTIAMSYFSVFIVSFCLYPFFENPRKYWEGLLAVIIHLMIGIFLVFAGGFTVLFYGLLLPFFTKGLLGGYIFYAQHNFPGVELAENEDWDYVKAALKSSSYIKVNRFWRWVMANVGFHHVHHLNARIPFYRLPEAMEHIPELQRPTITTLALSDIFKCLQLKLWDSDNKQMITLRELKATPIQ